MERFMELYQTVYQDLYRLAYFYLGNAADAEDAVQETALAACEHFEKLKNQEAFRPWIFRILVNCCRKYWRRRKGRELPLEEMEQAYEPKLSSWAEVRELLRCLDEEERLIVALRVFGGYQSQEIARMLNRNHSTIRSRYRRALKKLEQEVAQGKEM